MSGRLQTSMRGSNISGKRNDPKNRKSDFLKIFEFEISELFKTHQLISVDKLNFVKVSLI
jgi:hypothetical protein